MTRRFVPRNLLAMIVAAMLLLSVASTAGADSASADTLLARKVHADVNRRLASLGQVNTVARRPDVEYTSKVKAWADKSGVRKIETTDNDDDGDVINEYYFAEGSLVFAYQAIKGFNDAGKQVTRNEQRQYFRDGRMFKWLGGMEKASMESGSADFESESRLRLAAATFFLQVARQSFARKASGVPATRQ